MSEIIVGTLKQSIIDYAGCSLSEAPVVVDLQEFLRHLANSRDSISKPDPDRQIVIDWLANDPIDKLHEFITFPEYAGFSQKEGNGRQTITLAVKRNGIGMVMGIRTKNAGEDHGACFLQNGSILQRITPPALDYIIRTIYTCGPEIHKKYLKKL
jgi:hypothetical protein